MAADAMETLAGRYTRRAVRSVFTYTREAHPGENYRHHTSMDDKRSNARAFRDHSHIRRRILLDDLAGTAHRAYGLLPNMTWIIGPGGFIHYKSSWTSPADVENTLEAILDFQTNRAKNEWVAFYSERSAWSTRDLAQFKEGLLRNGKSRERSKAINIDKLSQLERNLQEDFAREDVQGICQRSPVR